MKNIRNKKGATLREQIIVILIIFIIASLAFAVFIFVKAKKWSKESSQSQTMPEGRAKSEERRPPAGETTLVARP